MSQSKLLTQNLTPLALKPVEILLTPANKPRAPGFTIYNKQNSHKTVSACGSTNPP